MEVFMSNRNVTVIIPSLDPDEKLIQTVEGLETAGFDDILIVNDGSSAEHLKFFPDIDAHQSCTVISHRRNRGKGAALKSAFKYFLNYRTGRSGVVTVDSDGQHLPQDVVKCAEKMLKTGKPVLGCRDFSRKDIPARSRFGNKVTKAVLRLLCGVKVSDTQTGLRAIPAEYIPDMIKIKGNRYEYETNMLLDLKRRDVAVSEVPIETVYINENRNSHFRPVIDSLRIYKLLFSFLFSSLFTTLIELVLFSLMLTFLFTGKYDVFFATLLSRVISGFINYLFNRKRVFGSQESVGRSMTRYFTLALTLGVISAVSVKLLSLLLGAEGSIARTCIKMVVDTVLFIMSFRFQQNWVFAPKKAKDSQKKSGKLTVGKVVRRVFGCIGTAILYLLIALIVAVTIVANGPSKSLRDALVLSAMQASATKWVPGLFLSDAKVDEIVANSYVDSKLIVDIDDYGNDVVTEDEWKKAIDGMIYIPANYNNFKAYILLIKDPSRVYVGASSSDFEHATEGKRIFAMANKEDAIALMNGGEFHDSGGVGKGGQPIGLTYSKGKCVWNDGNKRTFIGITSENKLFVSEGMTKAKADELGIRDAVCFQTGNVLIESDGADVNIHYREDNTGAAQRAAIGQRADGTFIFLVTDGRTASSVGATYNDIIDIMVSYGAVTAGMLDGGSSAMLYYEDYYNKYDIDTSDLDEYQKKGLANRYKAFTPPRRIPTFFCVSR